jgi:hypothetical protein
LSKLDDILIHRHGHLFQILELLLLQLDNPLGNMMCTENISKFKLIDSQVPHGLSRKHPTTRM